MSTPWIIIIGIVLLSGFFWTILYQKKKLKQGWYDLGGVRKAILTATTKQELEDALEALRLIQRTSFSNEYLIGACIALTMLINDKIKIDYPLSQ